MALTLLFLTLGELCLSPVGLSAMTKLAPKVIRGQIMGLWFTSIALGSLIGGHVSIENIQDLPSIFMSSTLVLLITAIILWLIKKPILKMISTNNDSSNIHT